MMGNITEGATWGLPVVPRDVKSFLTACRALNAIEEIIQEDRLQALKECSALPVGNIHLEDDAVASILVRLSKHPWRHLVMSDADFCQDVARILGHLRTRLSRERGASGVHSSLIARRLILLRSAGCGPFFQTDIEDYCGGWYLPPAWSEHPLSPAGPSQPAASPDELLSTSWRVDRFLADVVIYWSDATRGHRATMLLRDGVECDGKRTASQFHLPHHPRHTVPVTLAALELNDEDEETIVQVPKVRLKLFAVAASAGAAMTPPHRDVPSAIHLLSALGSDPADPSLRVAHLRMVTLGSLSVCSGVPVKKLLSLGLMKTSRHGGIFSDHLELVIGSFGTELAGRIAPQSVMLPVPEIVTGWVRGLVERCGPSDNLAGLVPDDPLGNLLMDLGRYLNRPVRDAEFVHRAFDYIALVEEQTHPGVFSLLTGRPWGPYRADASYISVPGEFIWAQARKIQDKLLQLAGFQPGGDACPEEFRQRRVGADCLPLSECRGPLLVTLDHVTNAEQAAGAMELDAKLHGQRPTSGHPHPCTLKGPDNTFLFSDKDHGGGRRTRLLPRIQSGEQP